MKANQALVEMLGELQRKTGHSCPNRTGLATGSKPWIVPIPGTTKQHRLEENIASINVKLSKEDLHHIDEATAKVSIEGERHPAILSKSLGL